MKGLQAFRRDSAEIYLVGILLPFLSQVGEGGGLDHGAVLTLKADNVPRGLLQT